MNNDKHFQIDPVCGMKIKLKSNSNYNVLKVKHKERQFYFCSTFCMEAFKIAPEEHLKNFDKLISELNHFDYKG